MKIPTRDDIYSQNLFIIKTRPDRFYRGRCLNKEHIIKFRKELIIPVTE